MMLSAVSRPRSFIAKERPGVGEAGRGIAAIIEMVTLTRLDCAVASSGLMRSGLAEAVHHVRHRQAFGKVLIDQPLMACVLADHYLRHRGQVGAA